ncbi:MAG: glycosyltransferase family 2 protein [Pseudomonadota bacterium]
MRLSLCMIVKDEENMLEECLALARPHVDEIVIVDTGSSDRTPEIIERYADRGAEFAWRDDFAAARNYAISQASGDWLLVLDADERIESKGFDVLREEITQAPLKALALEVRDYSDDALQPDWLPLKEPTPYARAMRGYVAMPVLRLFRRDAGLSFRGRIHELVTPPDGPGSLGHSAAIIHHYHDADPSKPQHERQAHYLRILEEELKQRPEGRLHVAAGIACMYHVHNYPRAVWHYEQALAQGYHPEKTQEGLAEALYRAGELEAARVQYEALMDAGYRSLAACLNLANLSVKSGQSAKALEYLQLARERCPVGTSLHHTIDHNIRHLKARQGA